MRTWARMVLDLFEADERRALGWLIPLVVLTSLMETAGIASVMPFLALVGNPETIRGDGPLAWGFETLGFQSVNGYLMFLGGLSLAALLVSNGMSALMTWRLRAFAENRGHRLANRLLRTYLSQPYVFFLNRNSSELVQNLLSEVTMIVNGVLTPLLNLVAKAVATVFVLALVFLVNPLLALAATVVFGVTYAGIYFAARALLVRLGQARLDANSRRFRFAGEAIHALKELRLLRREGSYLGRFDSATRRFADANIRSHVIAQVPRYLLEAIAFGGVLLIVIVLLASGRGLQQVLPLIGVYAFAAYRLMPALQTVFSGLATLRYNQAPLRRVVGDLNSIASLDKTQRVDAAAEEPALPFENAIEVRNVVFRYPNTERPALDDVNLSIAARSTVAIVGSTGSGKTTLVDVLLGLLTPQRGSVLVDGVPLDERNVRRWYRNVGYVPQSIYLTDDSVAANIALGVAPDRIDRDAVERAARAAQIHEFVVNELPGGYDTVVGERGVRLSGGQRQRIGIARALYHDPKVLFFDEATSALDGSTERSVFEAIEAMRGTKTIVLIAHRLTTVRAADTIFLIDRGRLAAEDSYEGLLRSNATFREMAGTPS